MPDSEDQSDELLALASIYSEETLVIDPAVDDPGGRSSGKFYAAVDLPKPSYLQLQDSVVQHTIKHLSPITLSFTLPHDYPSTSPPIYTLTCAWLSELQIKKLSSELDRLWKDNSGMVVLFTWMSVLQNQTIEILELGNTLTVTQDVLEVLIEYNSQKSAKEFAETLYTCEVCFRDRPGSASIRFDDCGHVYCKDCMREYFTTQISDGSVKRLICPWDECNSLASTEQVKDLVSAELFERYDQLLLQLSLDTMPDVIYCPRKDCSYPAEVDSKAGMGRCPSCHFCFCATCSKTYHSPSPCALPRSLAELTSKDEPDKETKVFSTLAELESNDETDKGTKALSKRIVWELKQNMMSLDWMEKYSKKCPHCKAQIQKLSGCNKMACLKCNTYFCWICLEILPHNMPYEHFRDIGNPRCFNMLLIEPENEQDGAAAAADLHWSSDSDDED